MGRKRTRTQDIREFDIDTGTARLEPVAGEPNSWVLWVNGVPSSPVTIGEPTRLDFEYLDWMSRILEVQLGTDHPRMVHIGAAACALPRWAAARYPQARQTAVDIDAKLLTLVREWFDLPRAPRLALRPGDGAAEIATFAPGSLDVVVRDAFAGDTTPPALADDAFFSACARALKPTGVYLANIADRPPHDALRSEVLRMRSRFTHVALAADPGQIRGRRWGNVVALATMEEPDLIAIAKALRRGPAQAAVLTGGDLDRYCGAN
ncbi:fused MFS/spermidine synthase [Brevibacterium sp. 50QC2O2]|jgi:SAM-dependent methyltransferase|uniref:spermidine synthase n=1 Tax=Brevibacterium sp. 50QC2O2 TaxID=2968459 RepID=UPI00211D0510|nr:fused MFS/spermidine synthase [Brevibacterium sp. 50QC2O2]MCQ9388367.1 fused MFS/spermidine synthase [Brevibacterium sp. 50QC2O2]